MSRPEFPGQGRREFLVASVRALAFSAGASWMPQALAFSVGIAGTSSTPESGKIRGFPFETLDSYLTPTDRFFLRSHLEMPVLNAAAFRLQIGGWVERPFSVGLADLLRLPQASHPVTFECSGNGVGGGFVSTGEWSGPLLFPLLERARPRRGAVELLMEGADAGLDEMVPVPVQYARSVPLEVLREVPGFLATRMNGEVLRAAHGFPVRAVLPGLYSLQNVKWLVRLTVLEKPYRGFYQTQRYVEMRQASEGIRVREIERMRVKSQIARIEARSGSGHPSYRVTGAAWSGGKGIRAVEVSTDGGGTWREATLGESRGRYAWTLWSFDWIGAFPGVHEVVARATDGSGRRQPLQRDPQVLTGYVNNWCHRKTVTVPK